MGISVGPHTIRSGLKVGVLWLPSLSWEWEVVVCLSGPGVFVILAVCQSGLGNGHQVITPALTASSISLYRSCTPLPPTLTIFFLFFSAKELGREKVIEWQDNTNTTDSPEKKDEKILHPCIV